MFERYTFEDPHGQAHAVDVGGMSYLAAAFLGAFFVLWKAGMGAFASALPSNLLIVLVVVAATGLTSFALPAVQQLVVLAVAVPVLLTIQSILMIGIVRKAYRNRGWIVHEST